MEVTLEMVRIALAVMSGRKRELTQSEASTLGVDVDHEGVYVIPPVVERCELIIAAVLHSAAKNVTVSFTRIDRR